MDHDNIIKYCQRPFKNADHQTEVLLNNINEVVSETDTLYILGDFCWEKKKFQSLRERIVCRNIHFLKGNHDYKQSGFPYMERVKFNKRKFLVCHYPLATCPPGYVNLHGHTHRTMQDLYWRMDVGVDSHEYYPISMDYIIAHTEPYGTHHGDV
jgi:calcineurin-like phosphoesterase family protein